MTSCVQHPMPSSGELVVVVSLSSRALRPHGSNDGTEHDITAVPG
jgi:hypothetical protein